MKKVLLWISFIAILIAIVILGVLGVTNYDWWAYPFVFIAAYLATDTFFHFYRSFERE